MDSLDPAEASLKNVAKLLNNGTANSENLLKQKNIYAVSDSGQASSTNWVQYSTPGSGQHQETGGGTPFLSWTNQVL